MVFTVYLIWCLLEYGRTLIIYILVVVFCCDVIYYESSHPASLCLLDTQLPCSLLVTTTTRPPKRRLVLPTNGNHPVPPIAIPDMDDVLHPMSSRGLDLGDPSLNTTGGPSACALHLLFFGYWWLGHTVNSLGSHDITSWSRIKCSTSHTFTIARGRHVDINSWDCYPMYTK